MHKLPADLIPASKGRLVEAQIALVQNGDAGYVADGAAADENVDDKKIESALTNSFAAGVLQLSEVVFDKSHQHAIMSFSFYCGVLCGHGETMVFTKTVKGWKKSKRHCSGWIS